MSGELRWSPTAEIEKIMKTDWAKASPKKAVCTLQNLIGMAKRIAGNDRHPNRAADADFILELAHQICIDVRSRWKP